MISNRSLLLAQLALIVALAWTVVYLGRDEIRGWFGSEAREAPPARGAADSDGGPDVQVSEAVQKASGLLTQQLQAHRLQPSLPVQGVVADLRPLTLQVAQLRAAAAEAQASRAVATRAAAEHARVLALYEDERNASERALQAAQADKLAGEARLAGAESASAAAREQLRQEWGDTLARWAQAGSPELAPLLDGREALLVVTLRLADPPPRLGPLEFTSAGGQGKPRRAQPVSPATRADPGLPGATWFYRAPAKGLRVGERIAGRLPTGAVAEEGVLVPARAVVWHAGKAWVYVQEAADRFERRAVRATAPAGDGWFETGLEAGERVVVSGAQLLLSEEFRGSITNENED
ncbi:MAG TPA: hypothetical protein VLC55_13705 [Burkholderiales bacterium]|nr:hypothetical protein [Burkholderiales bacterium]